MKYKVQFNGLNLKMEIMVIYEVNLSIEKEIYNDFQIWLKEHIKEMLKFPGFIKARILKPENEKNRDYEELTVHYQLQNRASLTVYFDQFAERMREKGLIRFQDKFSAQRRILEIEEQILKEFPL